MTLKACRPVLSATKPLFRGYQ